MLAAMATGVTEELSDLVAEEIRVMMTRRRISGRQLAQRLGVSAAWVSYRLTGKQPIDLNDLAAIARVLGVTARDLLPRPDEGRVIRPAGTGITTAYAPPAGSVEQSSRTGDSAARRAPRGRTPGPSGARPDSGPAGRARGSATRRPVRTSPRRTRLTA